MRISLHVDPYYPKDANDGNTQWSQCSDRVRSALINETVPDTITVIPRITEVGVPVLFFEGDLDFIVNYVGMERALGNMTWNGSTGFSSNLNLTSWTYNPAPDKIEVNGGLQISDRGLTYIRVFNSGHLVPLDQPQASSAIFRRLLSLKSTYKP